jgi:hypothetical protein
MEFPGINPSGYQDEYFKSLKSHSEKLIILQTNPSVTAPIDCISATYTYTRDCFKIDSKFLATYSLSQNYLNKLTSPDTFVIQAQKWICVDTECPMTAYGLFVTRDGSHLTYSYLKKITPLVQGKIAQIIRDN